MKKQNRFANYAWFVLAYNIGVILWGAYVRATHAGAGCGSHWPLCNGQVIPLEPQIETIIEYVHRLTSGVDLPLVLLLAWWGFRLFPKGHRVRLGASLSVIFLVVEALVGAGLVKFEWVARDESTERVIIMGVHLVNTFLLLAWLTLTAWWASGGARIRLKDQGILLPALGVAFLGVMLIGVTGAVTALGDTLFPGATMADDFSPTAHLTIRLRVWHPIFAVGIGFYLIFLSLLLGLMRDSRPIKRFALVFTILLVIQLFAGLVNLLLRAPVWMQIVHLLLADSVWVALVLLAANALGVPQGAEVETLEQPEGTSPQFSVNLPARRP